MSLHKPQYLSERRISREEVSQRGGQRLVLSQGHKEGWKEKLFIIWFCVIH